MNPRQNWENTASPSVVKGNSKLFLTGQDSAADFNLFYFVFNAAISRLPRKPVLTYFAEILFFYSGWLLQE